MLNAIIDFSLRNRLLVIVATLGGAVAGAFALRGLDLDAFPDTTPVQVQINTVDPASAPEAIEQQITIPIEQALAGMPRLESIRSTSRFGLSQVVVTFADGTDIYFARQQVNERLKLAALSDTVKPQLGPVSTGLGEVFHYVVRTASAEKTEARTTQDWIIKPQLRTVKGVAEINGWGGFEKQFQIRVDPQKLVRHGLTFQQVLDTIPGGNRNVGGDPVQRGSEALPIHGVGRISTVGEIENMVVAARDGVPIRVRDVADVEGGHEIRRGAVTLDGKGEVVLGLGFMLMGENSHEVATALQKKLDKVKEALPPGTRVETVYNRTEVVDEVIDTVRKNLFEAGLLVIAVLFLFLGNLRAALIVAVAIPLSLLFAFCGMLRFSIAASLLSLGAIDFGMVVDSSVVMVENCVRHLAHGDATKSKLEIVRDAAVEVRGPTLFGELIIMIVYLPILTLEGVEGKLFRPMALTVIFALAGSMVLSLTLMPVLASLLLPRKIEEREPLLMRLARLAYAPLLRFTLHHKLPVLLIAGLVLAVAFGLIAPRLGSEFVPRLSEGSIAIAITRLSGTSLEEAVERNTRIERGLLHEFPDEIAHVWSRAGTAEVATDPMGVEQTDTYIALKPRAGWTKEGVKTQADLTDQIKEYLRDVPGVRLGYRQPIEMRLNEMISGVKGDLVVKLFGDDLEVLKVKAEEIESLLKKIPGSADVGFEQITGQAVLQVTPRPDALARYGVPRATVLNLVQAMGGIPAGELVQGMYRFPIAVRLPERLRRDTEALKEVLVVTPLGERIPLERLAEIKVVEDRPSTITREWGQRCISISASVKNRDLGGFVEEAKRKINDEIKLPAGRYRVEWGGQFEHLLSAQQKLWVVVPVALCLIFLLLYLAYGSLIDALRVFTGIPFAAVGGIFALWLRDMPFSISAAIGFIAMSGVAVLDDMILVSTIRQLRDQGVPLEEAVTRAAVTRLRPVLMTTLVASLGFLPMAFSTGMGAEVQRPLATVVIGGVISAMVMSLLVVRVLYVVFQAPGGNGTRLRADLADQRGVDQLTSASSAHPRPFG